MTLSLPVITDVRSAISLEPPAAVAADACIAGLPEFNAQSDIVVLIYSFISVLGCLILVLRCNDAPGKNEEYEESCVKSVVTREKVLLSVEIELANG